jgi:hypothetical protein
MAEMRKTYNIFVGKPEWRKTLGRPRRRWKENIRLDLRKRVWEAVYRMHLAQDMDQWRALVSTVKKFRFP